MGVFLAQLVGLFANVLVIAIIIRSLLSFAPLDPYHPLVRILNQVTEPILAPIRRNMPQMGMFDLSPMIAIILLYVVSRVLQQIFLSALP